MTDAPLYTQPLPDDRHEKFAQAVAHGSQLRAAYVAAGFTDSKNAKKSASLLARRDYISDRIKFLKKELGDKLFEQTRMFEHETFQSFWQRGNLLIEQAVTQAKFEAAAKIYLAQAAMLGFDNNVGYVRAQVMGEDAPQEDGKPQTIEAQPNSHPAQPAFEGKVMKVINGGKE